MPKDYRQVVSFKQTEKYHEQSSLTWNVSVEDMAMLAWFTANACIEEVPIAWLSCMGGDQTLVAQQSGNRAWKLVSS